MKCVVKIKTMALVAVMCGFCTVSSDAMNKSVESSSSGSLSEIMLDYKQIDLNEVQAKKQEIEKISASNQSLIEKLKEKRDELTEQEKSKRQDLEKLQNEIKFGQDSKTMLQFEKKRNTLTKRISELETELQRYNRQINQIEGQLSELYNKTSKEKIEQVSEKIADLEDAIRKEKENKCPGDMARYNEFQNNNYLGMSAAQIEAIKARVANIKTQYDQDLINLKQKKADLEYSLNLIPIKKQDLANAKIFQDNCQTNLDKTEQRLQTLIDQNIQAKTKHEDKLKQAEILKKELPELQEKINAISEELALRAEQSKTYIKNVPVLDRFIKMVSNINIIKQKKGEGNEVLDAIKNILNSYPDDDCQKKQYLAILDFLQGRDNRVYSQDPNGIFYKLVNLNASQFLDDFYREDIRLIKNDNTSFEDFVSLYKTFKSGHYLRKNIDDTYTTDEETNHNAEASRRFLAPIVVINTLWTDNISQASKDLLNQISPLDRKGGRLSAIVIFMVDKEDEIQKLGFKVQKILNQTL